MLTGSGFTRATNVWLGSTKLAVTVVSDTSARVTLPTHAPGSLGLQIVTPGGTSATSAADRFGYLLPPAAAVTKLSATSGYAAKTAVVTITGTNFTGAKQVLVAGTAVAASVLSDTSVRVTLPPHAAGPVAVQVVGVGGTSAANAASVFTYRAS